MKFDDKIIYTPFFLLRYYFLLFLSIVLTNLLTKIFLPLAVFASFFILIIFFCALLLYNLKYPITAKKSNTSLIFNTILDITLFGRVIALYIENKKNFNFKRTFADMEQAFFDLFLRGFLFSISIYLVYALLSLFLYYQSGIITSGIYTFFPGIHLNPTILNFLSFYIIIHNLIILAGTIAGAIPFYIVSFGLIYYNSGVLISIIVGSLLNGTANLILPYAILELLSIALASGTGITLFSLIYYYFFGTFTSQNEFKKYYSVNIPKVIVGIGISLVLFLFAWDIEYYVLLDASGNMIYPPNWYYLLYVLDFVFSGASIIILFRVYKYGIINPLAFLYYFFPSFLLLFNITAGHSFYWSNLLQVSITAFLVFFSSFTVIFSALGLNEIFTTSSGNKIDSQFFILRARGKSMYPTIKNGDLVIVENTTAPSRLKIGEILFLRIPMKYAPPVRSGRYVAHRLIGINGQYLVTKGDNEPKQDRKIPIWYWEGIVVAKIMAKVDDTILLENLSSDKSIFDIVQSKRDQILNVLRKMDEGTDRYFSLKSVKTRAIVSIVIAILFTVFVFLV